MKIAGDLWKSAFFHSVEVLAFEKDIDLVISLFEMAPNVAFRRIHLKEEYSV